MKIITETLSSGELKQMAAATLINMRPSQGNRSRGIENEEMRKKIIAIVAKRIER